MDTRNEVAVEPSGPALFTPTFALVAVASLAYFTAAGMTIPALPRLVSGTLGGGNVAVGVVFGAFSVSAVLLRPPAGQFGDRRGRRPLMVVGAVLAAASILAYGLAPNAAVLVALRLVTGAGEALFFVGMLTTFTDLAPVERRGEAMSLASLALGVRPRSGQRAPRSAEPGHGHHFRVHRHRLRRRSHNDGDRRGDVRSTGGVPRRSGDSRGWARPDRGHPARATDGA